MSNTDLTSTTRELHHRSMSGARIPHSVNPGPQLPCAHCQLLRSGSDFADDHVDAPCASCRATVQARLDAECERVVAELVRRGARKVHGAKAIRAAAERVDANGFKVLRALVERGVLVKVTSGEENTTTGRVRHPTFRLVQA